MIRRVLIVLGITAAFAAGWMGGSRRTAPPVEAPAPLSARPGPPASDPLLPIPPAPVASTPEEVDPKPTAADAAEIIDALRTGSLESPTLLGAPLTAVNLPDFLQRSGAKVRFSTSPTQSPIPGAKSLLERLPSGAAYWRPRALEPAEVNRFVNEWTLWKSGKPAGLILDLRHFTDPNNFSGAALLAALFTTPGRTLYTLQGFNQPQQVFKSERQPIDLPSWMPLVVLTNRHTRGAAEAAAHSLRAHSRALIIGQPTAGEGGLYRETRLKSGLLLRLATARATAADGTELMGSGLEPDVWVEMDPAEEARAFHAAWTQGAAALISEPPALPRLHHDISAIVLDAGVASAPAPGPADPILRAGVDAVTAIQARLATPTPPPSSPKSR
jgi:carboxyl-terminal processing protease